VLRDPEFGALLRDPEFGTPLPEQVGSRSSRFQIDREQVPSRGETLSDRSGAGREPGGVDWRSIRSRSRAGFGRVQSDRKQLERQAESLWTVRRAGRERGPVDRRSTGGSSRAGGKRLARSRREGGSCDEEGWTGSEQLGGRSREGSRRGQWLASRAPARSGVRGRAREIRRPWAGRRRGRSCRWGPRPSRPGQRRQHRCRRGDWPFGPPCSPRR